MTAANLLSHWYEQVWNNANEALIEEKMHRDVIIHGLDPLGTTHGIGHFKTFYKNFREAFPQIHVDVQPLVSDNEFATAYCTVTAKNVSGKEVTFTGLTVLRTVDGMLVEGWNNFDFLKMYQQLGHILVSAIEEK